MIITRLELQNFGRHKTVSFDCNGPVVGLVGPNGSGKSTIMTAIEFAITGETQDPIETYVRHGENNGSVLLEFQKNGHKGTIFRQFGATAKRRLFFQDKEFRSAKDVNTRIAEIFGADRKAIANAVFINQGSMEKVLFSSFPNRRDMFLQMLNMTFCTQRATMLKLEITKQQAGIVDLNPMLMMEQTNLKGCQDDIAAEELRKSEIAVHPEMLVWLRAKAAAGARIQVLSGIINQLEVRITDKRNALQKMEHDHGIPIHDLGDRLKAAKTEAAAAKQATETARRIYNGVHGLARLETQKSSKQVEALAGSTIPGQKDALEQNISKVQAELSVVQQYVDAHRRVSSAGDALNAAVALVSAIPVQPVIPSQLTDMENELNRLMGEINSLTAAERTQRDMLKFLDGKAVTGSVCPTCHVDFANHELVNLEHLRQTVTVESVSGLKTMLDLASKTYATLRTARSEKEASLKDWTKQFNGAETLVETRKTQAREAQEHLVALRQRYPEPASLNTELLNQTLAGWQQELAALKPQEAAWRAVLGNLETLAQEIKKLEEFRPSLGEINKFTPEWVQGTSNSEELAITQVSKLESIFNQADVLSTELGKDTKEWEGHDHELGELRAQANSEMDISVHQDLAEFVGKPLEALHAELVARETALAERTSKISLFQEIEAGINRRITDLRERMSKDEQRRLLVADLEYLHGMLGDNGVPMRWMEHNFERLAIDTQECLGKMNADFCVFRDPENPLTFQFRRLDEMQDCTFDMGKLSGGQRVRLCVAFLMALQRHLVKEVGLLVLDEPTVHVDDPGVDQLIELLTSMSQTLANAEHQIIVCDHNPKMLAAFDKVLKL